MEFIPAACYTPGPRNCPITLVVIHDMEAPEKGDTAESVARYFQNKSVQASAHYCIDVNSIVECVHESDVAWHAPGANHNGIGLEHAGYAAQTTKDWEDAYSLAMLRRSAQLTATICRRYKIPVRWLNGEQVAAGEAGICGHADVTAAFPNEGSHTDPGPNFPKALYVQLVAQAVKAQTPTPPVVKPRPAPAPSVGKQKAMAAHLAAALKQLRASEGYAQAKAHNPKAFAQTPVGQVDKMLQAAWLPADKLETVLKKLRGSSAYKQTRKTYANRFLTTHIGQCERELQVVLSLLNP